MSARAVAHALFRHQRKMLATLLLCLAGGGATIALSPVQWRAEATLLVEASRPDGAGALAAMLESRDLHAQVLNRFGDRLYPAVPLAQRADAFRHDLHIRPAEGLVRLSLDGPDAALAADALGGLLDRLAEKNRAVFTPQDAGGELARQAVQAREKLAAFRKRTGITEGSADKAALVRRRGELDGETSAAEAEASALADRLTVLKARLATTPATIELTNESERTKVAEDARAKLFELQTREAELLGKYQDTSVTVQNLRAEKRKVEELLGKLETTTQNRVTSGTNPVYQDVEKDAFRTEAALSAAKARLKSSQRQLADLDSRLAALAGSERVLVELEQATVAADSQLTRRTGSGAAIEGIGIVSSATAGSRPVGPAPWVVMAVSGGMGVVLALLLAALAQKFSTRIVTPADVERRLGLPVLTTIPRES
ncbi:MAG: hypothetical protein H7Z12_20540 [Rhodospirillaceae bacterium]|nr:hypothetical protein [Rhodospirillales bacterium]